MTTAPKSNDEGGVWVWRRRRRGLSGAMLATKAEHRQMLVEFDRRVAAGAKPDLAWGATVTQWWRGLRPAERRRRTSSGWVLAILLIIERRRLALGWSAAEMEMEDKSGDIPHGAYAKWRKPWAGDDNRMPTEETLVTLINIIGGRVVGDDWVFRMPKMPLSVEQYERKLSNLEVRHSRKRPGEKRGWVCSRGVKERMRELSARGVAGQRHIPSSKRREGGSLGGKASALAMSAKQKSARGLAGAKARWGKNATS